MSEMETDITLPVCQPNENTTFTQKRKPHSTYCTQQKQHMLVICPLQRRYTCALLQLLYTVKKCIPQKPLDVLYKNEYRSQNDVEYGTKQKCHVSLHQVFLTRQILMEFFIAYSSILAKSAGRIYKPVHHTKLTTCYIICFSY